MESPVERCRVAINCETRALCAMQQLLTGSSGNIGTELRYLSHHREKRMIKTKIDWALGADVRVRGAARSGGEWTLETVRVGPSRSPGCGRA